MSEGGKALRERLLAQAATRTASVTIDGETYRVREMQADTYAAYMVFLASGREEKDQKKRQGQAFALVLSECVVDEDNEPILSAEDALVVAASARVVYRLVNKILDLSGFGEREKKDD